MGIASLIVIAMTFMTLSQVRGSRILGVFPMPLFSHQKVFRALMTELHSRGHEIVILTSHPMHNTNLTNYTEIDMSGGVAVWRSYYNYQQLKKHEESRFNYIKISAKCSRDLCKLMFNLQEVKTLLRDRQKNDNFDLVITGWYMHPCTTGFAHHFSAPLIGISTLGLLFSGHKSIGNPTHPVYFTEVFNAYLKTPTFREKIDRLIYFFAYLWLWHTTVIPEQDIIARQFFGDNMPYIGDLETNVSLVFTALQTNHYCVVPKVPALIELGPIHLEETKPLTKDLQDYLDHASGGTIYFSLGTNIPSDSLPAETRNMFLDVFSQLTDFRILWKWDGDDIPNLPSNVKIGGWFPQLDVLAHPKMKAFIYQGGLQSTEEAIKVQVPVIGFPFAVDQDLNLRRIVDYGAGIKLDINTATKDIILRAIKAVIFNPKYKSNMKKLSHISSDQTQTPMERAVWWIEYVIRHKGATHLRAAWMDLTWYEFLMLDVVAVLILIFALLVWSLYYICDLVLRKYIISHKEKIKLQ